MKKSKSKYLLKENGKEYQLSAEKYQNKIRITCIKLENNNIYIGDYSLIDFRKKNTKFNSIQNINDALRIINNIIESEMVSIEPQDSYINIKFYIKDNNKNQNFILKANFASNSANDKKSALIHHPPSSNNYPNKNNPITSPSQKEEGSYTKSLYDNFQEQNNYNELIQGNINQINYNNSKIIELIDQNNRLKKENDLLRNEINKSKAESEELKNQIQFLNHEKNEIIKHNMIVREDENRDKLKTKSEIEKLKNDLYNLKNQYDNKFEEYEKNKENEINMLKSRINELLNNLKNMENILKENSELKLQLHHLSDINNNNSIILNKKNTQIFDLENRMKAIIGQNKTVYKADIIKSKNELDFLTRKICVDNNRININLLYKATIDSDRAEVFHDKCDQANSSIVLVEIENGRRFGGFTKCSWEGDDIEKNDNYAFVFSLDELKIYDIIKGEAAIGCYRNYGPVFMGYQIIIYDEAFRNGGETALKRANYETNKDYELSGGLKQFNVKEIEVFEVEFE